MCAEHTIILATCRHKWQWYVSCSLCVFCSKSQALVVAALIAEACGSWDLICLLERVVFSSLAAFLLSCEVAKESSIC